MMMLSKQKIIVVLAIIYCLMATIQGNGNNVTEKACRLSDSDGIIIFERLVRLVANMYIAYLNPLWSLLAALATVICYGVHFTYESYVSGSVAQPYDLPWCILSAWSLIMDWMVIAAYMVVQTTSHIGSEFLGIIVGCVLVTMGIHTSTAFSGESSTLRNVAIILWLIFYFPWIYWPYVSLFEPYYVGPYRPLLPHQRLMAHFLNFFYNFWYSASLGPYGSSSSSPYYGSQPYDPYYPSYNTYGYQSNGPSWWSSLFSGSGQYPAPSSYSAYNYAPRSYYSHSPSASSCSSYSPETYGHYKNCHCHQLNGQII